MNFQVMRELCLINRVLQHISFFTGLRNNPANRHVDCLCIMRTIILGNEIIQHHSQPCELIV